MHVGTNDIHNRASFDDIIKDYYNLIATIRNKHSSVQIIVSAIIPRPCDYYESDSIVRAVNSHLNKVMSKDLNFKFVCTYKPFTYCGKPKIGLYARLDGGLHLNAEGSNRLKHFFSASYYSSVNSNTADLQLSASYGACGVNASLQLTIWIYWSKFFFL